MRKEEVTYVERKSSVPNRPVRPSSGEDGTDYGS